MRWKLYGEFFESILSVSRSLLEHKIQDAEEKLNNILNYIKGNRVGI